MLEIELKLPLANPLDVQNFLTLDLIKALSMTEHFLSTTYFDTLQADLKQLNMALRIRNDAGTLVQTVKYSAHLNDDALQKRYEWDSLIHDFQPNLMCMGDEAIRTMILEKIAAKPLVAIFTTEFTRRIWRYHSACGSEVEIALDQGSICCGARQIPLCEIELELTCGTNEQVLHDLAKLFKDAIAVLPDASSKAKRGYALAAL